jgi:hypothetical protein
MRRCPDMLRPPIRFALRCVRVSGAVQVEDMPYLLMPPNATFDGKIT